MESLKYGSHSTDEKPVGKRVDVAYAMLILMVKSLSLSPAQFLFMSPFLWCFSFLVNYFFQVSFNSMLYEAKIALLSNFKKWSITYLSLPCCLYQ